jgi:hypothetical protein
MDLLLLYEDGEKGSFKRKPFSPPLRAAHAPG